jgi:hypothetical protein
MLTKRLTDVDVVDIKTLCENRALESRFLDFKVEAIGVGEKDKREFLADISAFANASGGDLILGVKTKDGAADEICGIDLDDPDKEKQRLNNIARDGLEPRVSGIDMAWLPISGTRGIMVIRVPRSWSAPHRVTFLKEMNFFARNSAGKNPMSVDELRRAFNLSESVAEKIRAFREERLQIIGARQLPFDLQAGPKLVAHIVPLGAIVDPLDLQIDRDSEGTVRPIGSTGSTSQHCLEGFATLTHETPVTAYSLMFRTGAVECVAGIAPDGSSGQSVDWYRIENAVFESWKQFVPFASNFGVDPPIYFFATLSEVANLNLQQFSAAGFGTPRNIVRLPEVFIGVDEFGNRPESLFKRLLEVTANAFGLSRCPSYDANGKFTG